MVGTFFAKGQPCVAGQILIQLYKSKARNPPVCPYGQPIAVFIQALHHYCRGYCCQIPCLLRAVVMFFFVVVALTSLNHGRGLWVSKKLAPQRESLYHLISCR